MADGNLLWQGKKKTLQSGIFVGEPSHVMMFISIEFVVVLIPMRILSCLLSFASDLLRSPESLVNKAECKIFKIGMY